MAYKLLDDSNLGYLIGKIKAAFWRKSETTEVSIDSSPTSGSNNLVKSGGVYTALSSKADSSSVHSVPSGGTSGYVLAKASGTDYDLEWVAQSGGGGTTEIYPCTYGTTTQSDIATAVAAGKIPVCFYGDNLYIYAGESSAGYSQFTSVLYNSAQRVYVKTATWGNGTLSISGVTLNGTFEVSPSFYAPTTAGTSGYVLTSSGSGAPTWQAASGGSVTPMTNNEIDSAVNTAWV